MHLNEAFRALNALNEDTFSFSEDGVEKLSAFKDNDEDDDVVSVIDPEAETAEDTADSYVGKVIIDCSVCHSKIYKNKEEVTVDGELANTDEECPYCYSTEGFKVIGEIQPFGGTGTGDDTDDDADEEDAKSDDPDDSDDDVVEEDLLVRGPDGKLTTSQDNSWGTCKEWEYNESLDEGIKRTKKGEAEEYEKVTFAEVKKGDYVMGHHKDESTKPLKVLKIEEDEDDITLILQGGTTISGTADAPCFVFTKADMKTRKANAKHYDRRVKAGWNDYKRNKPTGDYGVGVSDEYDFVSDEDGSYMKRKQESLGESVNNVNVETDDDIINVTTDDNGRVTVSTEPVQAAESGDEVMVPVTDETQAAIESNGEGSGEFVDDVNIDEFDEESFDGMEESYLRESYDNVKSYKTTNVEQQGQRLFVEGVITFDNGAQKKTKIVLEATTCTKAGKYSFLLESNAHRPSHKNFNITGSLNNGRFITESASIKRSTSRR